MHYVASFSHQRVHYSIYQPTRRLRVVHVTCVRTVFVNFAEVDGQRADCDPHVTLYHGVRKIHSAPIQAGRMINIPFSIYIVLSFNWTSVAMA